VIRTSSRRLRTTTAPVKAPDRSVRAVLWCSSVSSRVPPSVRAIVTIRLTPIIGRLRATERAHGLGAGQNTWRACQTTCIGAQRSSHRPCPRLIAATCRATAPPAPRNRLTRAPVRRDLEQPNTQPVHWRTTVVGSDAPFICVCSFFLYRQQHTWACIATRRLHNLCHPWRNNDWRDTIVRNLRRFVQMQGLIQQSDL